MPVLNRLNQNGNVPVLNKKMETEGVRNLTWGKWGCYLQRGVGEGRRTFTNVL